MKLRHLWIGLVAVFLIGVFFLSVHPFEYDMWFNLKSGEIIAKMGLIRYDVFSQAAGREWYPSQWLFQWGMYWISVVGGLQLVKYVIAFFTTLTVALFALAARRIYRLPWPFVFPFGILFFGGTYMFYVARALDLVYVLFFLTLYITLLYVKRGKNYLWATVPITILWTNIHGSMMFPAAILGMFGAVTFIESRLSRQDGLTAKATQLGTWSVFAFLVTLLPPVGITQYQLLWLFWLKRSLVTFYIIEWQPLSQAPREFALYSGVVAGIAVCAAWALHRERSRKFILGLLPFIPFVIAPYLAVRNGFFGYAAAGIVLLETFTVLRPRITSLIKHVLLWSGIVLLCALAVWLVVVRRQESPVTFPERPVRFIRSEHLTGNMYNEFGIGGYLLYNLYPQNKVFFDGRADVYLCCEIPDDLLLDNVGLPQAQYQQIVDSLMDRYHIAFALIGTSTTVVRREVAITLSQEPDWHLVYWDDSYSIFVKDGTGNDAVIQKWGVTAATPFGQRPYKTGQQAQALAEYERMITFADSATSRNALAAIAYEKGDAVRAADELKMATFVNRSYDASYVALANLAISERSYDTARDMLRTALSYNDSRGLTYLLLAQIDANIYKDTEGAKNILRKGLQKVYDTPSRDQLQKELTTLENSKSLQGL